MTTDGPGKGDKVSWSWGGGAPSGMVAETKDQGEISIKSKRGNTIKKNASPDNPAVHVERSGNDVVKRASELTVEIKAAKNKNEDDDGGKGGSKRKAKSQEGLKPDANEDENEAEEASDTEDEHTINNQGKEVKRGGKDANKRQKIRQDGDLKSETDSSKASENESEEETIGTDEEETEEEEETKEEKEEGEDDNAKQSNANKKPANTKKPEVGKNNDEDNAPAASPQDEDQVSTRTRSRNKAV
ncbi:hypothetical protein E0Z10_g7426 [Xylaria hypoxylon]|uniref:Hypervirulence associated protein TUDOR domain-containing protein n=1 Tax=Xylaria hypoxylon TaxID=37992 RepID=A0A4Z0YBN5_9PEZI|nr:hypothetical protein E0Z10_g7426 [Xylaria hypoxylon]